MTVLFRLYRKAATERNDLAVQVRELQAELAISHAHAAHSAATIRQLEAANAETPCACCDELTQERDMAIQELDDVRAALHWLERLVKP